MSNMFNSYHQVVTNYDALNQVTTNGYDTTTHLITGSQNPAGLVTSFTYNSSHRPQQVTMQPINATHSYTWNSDSTLATYTDERGMVEAYYWDALQRLTGTSDARGATTNLYYLINGVPYPNSSGGTGILDLTGSKDRLGNWTYYVYDALRRLTAVTNANSVVTAYGYCECGSVASQTNALGTSVEQDITFLYDNQGNLTNATYADGYNITNRFDSLRRVTETGDGAANRWFYYDNLSRLTNVSNAYGSEQVKTFDVLDNPVHVTDANGIMITNTYDYLNRVLTRGYPDGGIEKFGYAAVGLIAYTNQIGMSNYYAYDAAGRKTYETNANGEILKYTNSAAGDLLSLTDGKNQTTKWNYDQYGRITNKVDQTGTAILTYTYDADDRLLSRWSAAKGTTYYTNDAVGNLTYVKYPSSTRVSLKYDWLNRLTNMLDAAGTTYYTYTMGNQVFTEIQPFSSSTVTNTYVNRLRTAMTLQQPSGLWTNKFVYDPAGRMTNVTSPAGAFGYTVGASSAGSRLIKKLLLPNTSYVTNTFDTVARLSGTYLDNSGNSILDSSAYGYNTANQRTAYTNAAGTYVQYTYDNIGQLKVATSSTSSENRGYAYDAAWNLSWLTNTSAIAYTVDTKNELTNWHGNSATYDSNGNRITQPSVTLTYDDENRLTNWVESSSFNSTFTYDGLGRLRVRSEYTWNGSSWGLSSTTWYVYDGMRVIQERNGMSGGNTPQISYTRGLDLSASMEGAGGIGGLLARSSGYSSGNWTTNHFYHADGDGNIMYVVDSSQNMAATYRYDPYGNTLSSSGTLASANLYRFSSKEIHVNSGMYIYLYRFYDPSSERWLNRDPLSCLASPVPRRVDSRLVSELFLGANLYEPLGNSPVNMYDAFGQTAAIPWPVIFEWPVGPAIVVCSAVISGVVVGSIANKNDERHKKCDFYKQWCDWANDRPPDDPGKGWKRNAPCDLCYEWCMNSGKWPMGSCPMGGKGGPRWPPGGKWPGGGGPVYPTPGQY